MNAAALDPILNPGRYVYVPPADAERFAFADAVAMVREPEGTSIVVDATRAAALGLDALPRWAWITLQLQTQLEAVGITAAFSAALGAEGISCNVVAGYHHDHLFVPEHRAGEALRILRGLRLPLPATPDDAGSTT